MKHPLSISSIEAKIYSVRGHKVMLDSDLAELYQVAIKQLNRQVRRNIKRFPDEFMFQLTPEEYEDLRCQIGTLKKTGQGHHRKYLPLVFTDYGILMLSSVLNTQRAIHVNIEIMRTFTRIRKIALTHKELAAKLSALESKVGKHDEDIQGIIGAIQQLLIQEEKPKRRMGFNAD